jgi:flagellar export protein FliJ
MSTSTRQLHRNLDTLIELRTRELERHQAELARKQALCARVESNIERLDQLYREAGRGSVISAELALNSAAYKQVVLQLADSQRQDLLLKTADLGESRTALQSVARQQQVLGQVLQQSLTRQLGAEQRKAQKQQDDLATQVWLRGQP